MDTHDLPYMVISEIQESVVEQSVSDMDIIDAELIEPMNEPLDEREIQMEELRKDMSDDMYVSCAGILEEKVASILPHDPHDLKYITNKFKDNGVSTFTRFAACNDNGLFGKDKNDGIFENATVADVGYTTDIYGRRKYTFKDCDTSLKVTVFAVGNVHMIAVNDNVMPLKEFLGIRHMRKDMSSESKDYSLHASYAPFESYDTQCTVICDTSKNDGNMMVMQRDIPVTFSIPDTTVNLLTIALIVIHRDYKSEL